MNWFTFNGMYSPVVYFDWKLFLVFEIVTILVELLVFKFLISGRTFVDLEGKVSKFSWLDSFLAVFLLNFASAMVAIPLWMIYSVGGS